MAKIVLTIDKTIPYIEMVTDRVLSEWGMAKTDVTFCKVFADRAEPSLFGGFAVTVLTIEAIEDVKTLISILEKTTDDWVHDGFIIRCLCSRRYTKKLEQLIAGLGGEIFYTEKPKYGTIASAMLDETGLNKAAKTFLSDYAGDDYELIIPIIKSIKTLPIKRQQTLTIEDLMVRLPSKAGSVPPWEFEKPMFAGNITEAVKVARRITDHTSPLVPLTILKNKLNTLFRLSVAYGLDPGNQKMEEYGKTVCNINSPYVYKILANQAKKHSPETYSKMLEEVLLTENNMKGGSVVSTKTQLEVLIIKLATMFR